METDAAAPCPSGEEKDGGGESERGREKKWRGNNRGREKQNRFTTADNSVSQRLTSQLASFI